MTDKTAKELIELLKENYHTPRDVEYLNEIEEELDSKEEIISKCIDILKEFKIKEYEDNFKVSGNITFDSSNTILKALVNVE